MSQEIKRRKAGAPVFPTPRKRPALELLRPPAWCSTTDLITELAQKVRVGARGAKGRRAKADDDNEPQAA